MRIAKVYARQIYDSRGNPTIEAEVTLESGSIGRAAVPSGASTGSHEALELRDNEKAFNGKGVLKAVANVNNHIKKHIVGDLADDQEAIDSKLRKLDGTPNKSKLGANSILAVSLACAHAAAREKNVPLYRHIADLADTEHFCMPIPMCNVLNGGKHAAGSTDIQEFMIVPVGLQDFSKALQACTEVFHALGSLLNKKDLATTVGDEGGYAPKLKDNTEPLDLLKGAVETAGYNFGQDIAVALDVAASELSADQGAYKLSKESPSQYSSQKLIEKYQAIVEHYPVISIEDGLAEDDWPNWAKLTSLLGHDTMIVGDDLTVTNPKYIKRAIGEKAANALLVKPNQIGTLSETIEAVKLAQKAGWRTIMSHRSGETEDTTIAHLAVGLHMPFIKTGSMSRSERLAKYNELLRIAETLPHRNTTCEL